jgi:type II secretion system protein I
MVRFVSAATRFSQRGFTFLEVLVSVAIIAIAFVTLLGSQSQSISVAEDSRFNVTAALLAQRKLTQLEIADFDDLFGEEGEFGEQYPSYRWRTEVQSLYEEDTGIAGSEELLKSVELTIWRGDRERPSYTVRTIIMNNPAQS